MVARRRRRGAQPTPTRFDVALGTTLGAGFWPWGPGTMGAVAGVALWYVWALLVKVLVADDNTAWVITAALTLAFAVSVTLLSIKPINRLETIWGPDPSMVVIDETVGVWLTLVAVPVTMEWQWVLAAFVLFRLFDILKPLGCRWLDRNIHGGWGVMLDDILAGVYGALVIAVVRLFV